MKKILKGIIVLITCTLIVGCGDSKAKEENINSKKQIEEVFSDMDNATVFETNGEKRKVLVIVCSVKFNSDNGSEIGTNIANKLMGVQSEKWFDYDYIMLELWNESVGRILSMTIDGKDLSEITQTYNWFQ